MADADDSLDILVRTKSDLSGADAANKALEELKRNVATSGTGAETAKGFFTNLNSKLEDTVGSHQKLIVALRTLSPELAGLGHELIAGLSNPLTAFLVIGGLSIEVMNKLNERSAALADALARVNEVQNLVNDSLQSGAWVDAFNQANLAADAYHETLENIEQKTISLSDKTDDAIAGMKRLADANQHIDDAQRDRDKAKIDAEQKEGFLSPEEAARKKAEIDNAADARRSAAANQTETDEIAKRQSELDAANRKHTSDQSDADAAIAAQRLTSQEAAKTQRLIQDLESQMAEKLKESQDVKQPKEARALAATKAKEDKGYIEQYKEQLVTQNEADAKAKRAMDDAEQKATASAELVNSLKRQIDQLQTAHDAAAQERSGTDAARRQQRQYETDAAAFASPEGQIYDLAAKGEYAKEHGQKVRADQQSALQVVKRIADASHQTVQQLLHLATLNVGQNEQFAAQIADLVRRQERLEHQGRGTHIPP